MLPNNGKGYTGFQQLSTFGSQFNADAALIWLILSRISTATLVQVKGVTNAGGVAAVGFVDILPLVNQVDGNNNAVQHRVVYRCPYFRLQGGANAIILDPQVGDIGIAVFADHDISSVTANKGQANPGSRRRFDMADAIYIGGVLNGVPTQFIEYSTAGITVTSQIGVTINAPTLTVNANIVTTGTIVNNGKHVDSTHTHSDPQGGNTGAPN